MRIDKISETQLKITDEVIKYVNKDSLEEDKIMLGARLLEINTLLAVFTEGK